MPNSPATPGTPADPARLGPPLAGPPLAGPPLAGPPLAGPPLAGPLVAGPPKAATPAGGQGAADEGLLRCLAALSRLATGQMELGDVLTRVAEFAALSIPGSDGAGLTLLEAGHPDTIVASAPFVAQVDAVQYSIAEGPCITSAAQARTVRSGMLDSDPHWPRFGPGIGHLGVHSALSIPLLIPDGVLGSLNVYARAPDAFDDDDVRIGELFAVPAAIAVQNAHVLAQTKRLAMQLKGALTNRAVIDHAIGVLMSHYGCSPVQAFDRLRQMSQAENTKLHAVARRIVEQAVRRARARARQAPT